jgi:IS66 C-terminal element
MVIPAQTIGSSIHSVMDTTTPAGPRTLRNRPVVVAPPAVCRLCCQNTGATGNGLPTLARHGQNERAMALNRKNALFAGSDGGGEHWAVIASLIETCKLNDADPYAYLADVISKIVNGHPNSRIDELLPWTYAELPLKAVA